MKTLLLVSLVLLSACASLKKATEPKIEKSVSVNASFDKVWTEVIQYYSEKGTPVKNLDRSSGLIATEDMRFNMPQDKKYIVCDEHKAMGMEVPRDGKIRFNVFVKKVSEKETSVQVNTFAVINDYQPGAAYPMPHLECYSTGEHERLLIEKLKGLK